MKLRYHTNTIKFIILVYFINKVNITYKIKYLIIDCHKSINN